MGSAVFVRWIAGDRVGCGCCGVSKAGTEMRRVRGFIDRIKPLFESEKHISNKMNM